MQPELMTTAGLILAALLTTGAAAAAEQLITPTPLQRAAAPNQPVAFTVGYGTANPCSALIIVPASRGTGRLESKASALDRQAKAEALDSK